MKKPLALIILDGFGIREEAFGNAIRAAHTPCLDRLFSDCPHTLLGASGLDVGLPDGQMGNSEVGHTNIGAGRVVYQELTRITKAIQEEDFFQNPALSAAFDACRLSGSALHLMGLLSDGGVHSHTSHLYALLEMARRRGLSRVYIHCFLDGRDTPPTSGVTYLRQLQAFISKLGIGQIATFAGRYYAMDRDSRWERLKLAYDALTEGKGQLCSDPVRALEDSYAAQVTDEFVLPAVCCPGAALAPGDAVVFFNFRPDRARELTRALCDDNFSGFERPRGRFPLHYVCLTQYDSSMPNVSVAFPPQSLNSILGECLSRQSLTQLRIAETEKYAHVTFFLNGGREAPFPGETRVLIPSPKVATYDLQPEMSAPAVAQEAVAQLETGQYDLMVLNFANCDMVGHTGVFDAAVKAVEAVDTCLSRVLDQIVRMGGRALVTADHGNADLMCLPDGSPVTAHSLSPVPLIAVNTGISALARGGRLCDIAPTLLDLLDLPKPTEMTGRSLLIKT